MASKVDETDGPDDDSMVRLLESEGYDAGGVREFAETLRAGISAGAVPDLPVGHFVYGLYLGSYLVRTHG
jgi:hypothetical protein